MTLFNSEILKPPPTKTKYTPGFVVAYESYGKKACKNEAFKEWVKQDLEQYAKYIADRAWKYHVYCHKKNRYKMDFRRWLHHQSWEDELFENQMKYDTPKEASDAFKKGEWNWCDGTDCSGIEVKWNYNDLIIVGEKVISKKDLPGVVFLLKFVQDR